MPSPYTDLDRPPLRQSALDRGCAAPWTQIRLHSEVESTNQVAADASRDGAAGGLVVVAEWQTGGRGRLGRPWISPARAGLTFSMLLRPDVPVGNWPQLSGLAAVAAATALTERTQVDVGIKWPNDLVVGERKVGGLLAEIVGGAVVIGIGVNVTTRRGELPRSDATSFALEGVQETDRHPLLLSVLRQIGSDYLAWLDDRGEANVLAAAYRRLCTTIGRRVRAELPGGKAIEGEAVDIDAAGHLVVDVAGVHRVIAAGDVVHLVPLS